MNHSLPWMPPPGLRMLQDLHALLSQTNITTVFITHDLDEALLLGDRVAVLLGGVLRQVGRPQDVFTAPSDGEVAAFVGVETVIAGRVSSSQNGQIIVEADGLHLEAVGDATCRNAGAVLLAPGGYHLIPCR